MCREVSVCVSRRGIKCAQLSSNCACASEGGQEMWVLALGVQCCLCVGGGVCSCSFSSVMKQIALAGCQGHGILV